MRIKCLGWLLSIFISITLTAFEDIERCTVCKEIGSHCVRSLDGFCDDADFGASLSEKKWEIHSANLVSSTTQIKLENFPNAFNPSILAIDSGFLMIFRYTPEPQTQPWISYIGIVELDNTLKPVSQPELIDTRKGNIETPSQAEDARIFRFQGQIYIIYNDNMEYVYPTTKERRDMYLAELLYVNGNYVIGPPLKLVHDTKYSSQMWQKNWVPFEWNNQLMLAYSINPHEILCADLETGICKPVYETNGSIDWDWGPLRGSSAPMLMDGEYFAFFHSGTQLRSEVSKNQKIWHYFMGAYTFSATPPFKITKITPFPIDDKGFYTKSDYDKRVIFPGGFTVSGSTIYVAYGKDDREIWIGTINLNQLRRTLIKVK